MLSDEWLSRYGLLENFNASVTRMGTGTGTGTHTGTGTWTTGVTAIALCTSCSPAKNVYHFIFKILENSFKKILVKVIYVAYKFPFFYPKNYDLVIIVIFLITQNYCMKMNVDQCLTEAYDSQ